MAFVASLAQANEVDTKLALCVASESDLSRLLCYDRAFGLPAVSIASPAPDEEIIIPKPATMPTIVKQTQTVVTPITQSITREAEIILEIDHRRTFGLESSAINSISGSIVHLRQLAHGQYVITLDNDQVWREIEERRRARYKIGDQVTISRKMMSYRLRLDKNGFSNNVRRLR